MMTCMRSAYWGHRTAASIHEGCRATATQALTPQFRNPPYHVTAQRNADFWIMGSLYSCCDIELNSTVLSTELRESRSASACTQGQESSVGRIVT